MQIEQLEVLIQANTEQFRREVGDVNDKLDKLAKVSEGSSARTQQSMKGMGAVAVAVGATIAKVATEAGKKLLQMGKDSVKFAMEAVESESLVATVFGESIGEITAWSDEMSQKLGLNAYEVRKNAGVFYNIAEAMGVSQKNAMSLSKGVVSLSNDMASFYNISTEEAVNKIRAGLTGQVVPLQQLGIVINENTIKETAWRTGMVRSGEELTNNQKVLARYMTILEQTRTAQGDMARTLDSPANQLRVLQARWQQLATTLGSLIIPVLNKILPYLQAFISLLQGAMNKIGQLFGVVGIKTVGTVEKISGGMGDLGDSAGVATGRVKELKKQLMGLQGFDEMNVLKEQESGGSGGGGGIGGGSGFEIDLPDYNMGLDESINASAENIKEKLRGAWESIKDFFSPMWEGIVVPAWEGLKAVWDSFMKTLKPSEGVLEAIGIAFKAIGEVIGIIVFTAIKIVINIFTGLIALIEAGVKTFKIVFALVVEGLAHIIVWVESIPKAWSSMVEAVKQWFNQLVYDIGMRLMQMQDNFNNTIQKVKDFFGGLWDNVKNGASGAWEGIKNVFSVVGNWFKDTFTKAWEGVKNVFSAGGAVFANIKDGIAETFKSVVNGLIGGINRVVSVPFNAINTALRKLKEISIAGISPFGFLSTISVPQIPHLAGGGVINSRTLAVMGEGGYKEAVLPLERNTEWAEQVADLINSSGGGNGNVNLVVKIGEEKIFEKAIDYMNDRSLMRGGVVLNI